MASCLASRRVWRNPTAGSRGCQRRSPTRKTLATSTAWVRVSPRGALGTPVACLRRATGAECLDGGRVRERVKSDISAPVIAERKIPGRHALGAVLGTLFLLVGLSVGGCGSVSGGLHADAEALLTATVVAPESKAAPDPAVGGPPVEAAPANPESLVGGGATPPRDEVVMA